MIPYSISAFTDSDAERNAYQKNWFVMERGIATLETRKLTVPVIILD